MPLARKRLGPALALLITAAFVLFVVLRPEQSANSKPPATPISFKQITTPARNPKSEIENQKSFTALLRDWEDSDEPDQRDAHQAELDTLLQTADLAELIRTLPADILNFTLGLPAFQTWIKTNPAEALALFSTRQEISESRVCIALATWFEKDPTASARYLRELPPGTWRENNLALASQLALKTSPANAANWASLLTSGPRQTSLLEQIATAWCAQNAAEAAAWIALQPNPLTREHLYAALAVAHAEKDPEQATAWLLQSVRPGEIRDQTMTNLTATWATTDPALISTWIDHLPEGEPRQTATRSLINLWSHHDRPAAQAWIAQMPPGPQRDEAQSHLDSLPVVTSAN